MVIHHFIMHLTFHKKGLHNPHILKFRGINMNENGIPFSFINYAAPGAAHCMARLSYGKRLWPSAADATRYLARKPNSRFSCDVIIFQN